MLNCVINGSHNVECIYVILRKPWHFYTEDTFSACFNNTLGNVKRLNIHQSDCITCKSFKIWFPNLRYHYLSKSKCYLNNVFSTYLMHLIIKLYKISMLTFYLLYNIITLYLPRMYNSKKPSLLRQKIISI